MFSMFRGYMDKKKIWRRKNLVHDSDKTNIINDNNIVEDTNIIIEENENHQRFKERQHSKEDNKNHFRRNHYKERYENDENKRNRIMNDDEEIHAKEDNKNYSRRNDKEQHAEDTLNGSHNNSVKEEESNPKQDVNHCDAAESGVLRQSVDGQPETAVKARSFTFKELVKATNHFEEKNLLGQGGFGRVYKGYLEDINEVVAIKQLDIHGCQGVREFVVEVMTLGMADHPNLVRLIGYCVEGEQRLLVYEYMPLGSLEDHLFGELRKRRELDWISRMKIAAGAAKGLEYLHGTMNPPVIYRDVKCSNILLGEGYHSKLSDFGLAKVGPSGDKTHVSTRVMGTYGYCAPDYALTGQLTFKSDIYSFGVVLLEILTGRPAIDHTKPAKERNLVDWAKPLFKDRKNFRLMADPTLKDRYPARGLYQTLAICAMCLQDQPSRRPAIQEIVHALTFLASKNFKEQRPESRRASLSPSPSPSPEISETDDETKA